MYKQNKIILDEFKKLAQQVQYELDNSSSRKETVVHSHRLAATMRVISILEKYDKKIKKGEDLKNYEGVGAHTVKRINEILEKGKLSEIKETMINKQSYIYIDELEKIIGIGHKTAKTLVDEYGIKSIEDLKKLSKRGDIKLNEQIQLGLKYLDKMKRNIPRKEVMEIDKYLHKKISEVDDELFGIVCGSYRRQKKTSNDIDLLLVHPGIKKMIDLKESTPNHLHEFVKLLIKDKFLLDGLTYKNYTSKYMGFCRLKGDKKAAIRRIDIRYLPYESYYPALLYFTGSGEFNQKMRQIAKDMEYQLNEYGLYSIADGKKKRIPVKSEKDIFEKLGMEYLAPKDR